MGVVAQEALSQYQGVLLLAAAACFRVAVERYSRQEVVLVVLERVSSNNNGVDNEFCQDSELCPP